MKFSQYLGLFSALLAMHTGMVHAAQVSGAGSSAAAPIYRSWGQAYEKATGISLVYESVGSSAGIRKIRDREVGFGASDVAPGAEELRRDGLAVFPIAITGIAPVVNLPRIGEGQLRLSGEVLARIFMGKISRWNAPEIAGLNPDLVLPDLPVKVIVRSDGSGTSYNFTDYLAKMSPEWKTAYGVKTRLDWPEGFSSAKGSDGVVQAVRETVGGIAYVDFGYVRDNKLNPVQMKNLEGDFVRPSIEAFRGALNHSEWVSRGDFTVTLTNQPGKGVWPITMGTFALVPLVADKVAQTQGALKFLVWSFMHGDALVHESNFVRLPNRVQAAAFKVISGIKDKAGNPIGLNLIGLDAAAR